MNLTEDNSRFDISPYWAKALAGTLKSSGSLTTSLDELNKRLEGDAKIQPRKQDGTNSRAPEKSFNGGVSVTMNELLRMGLSIQKKDFKDVCAGNSK